LRIFHDFKEKEQQYCSHNKKGDLFAERSSYNQHILQQHLSVIARKLSMSLAQLN